ncbi:MAG TPA: phosphotransferase [Acidimicrobiales bacterium]|nr:phosphotransferase [Acidimicrobiales bacterium]
MAELPGGLLELIPAHLEAQRWYGGHSGPALDGVDLEWGDRLWSDDDGSRSLWHAVVLARKDRYQLVIGERRAGERAEFLNGREEAVIGAIDRSYFYDATLDSELAKVLLEIASGGAEKASLARPISAEQSNTSLVFDDRIILKLFRKLQPGRNPDVEVTTTLAEAGFQHVAAPLVIWREHEFDLAFGQEFLAGGTEGWALASTSMRDLYNSAMLGPAEAGGDFGAEASRLGRMTAEMHAALAAGYGIGDPSQAREIWTTLLDSFPERVRGASEAADRDLLLLAETLLGRLSRVDNPGPFVRVHGDYHLGQVMRTDTGWYVLDFEGEPGRDLSERVGYSSPFKDVSSMLRSFHYATRHALFERPQSESEQLESVAVAWETHNRQAFLEGYRETVGIDSLLPPAESSAAVLLAYELDKALYELDYERAHRPDWVSIPLDALDRLFHEGEDVG